MFWTGAARRSAPGYTGLSPAEAAWGAVLTGCGWVVVEDLDSYLGKAEIENLSALGEILAVIRQVSPGVKVQLRCRLLSMESLNAALRLGVSQVCLRAEDGQDPALLNEVIVRFGSGRIKLG